jgi:hypothetical protein
MLVLFLLDDEWMLSVVRYANMLAGSRNDSASPVISEVDPNVEDDTHGLFEGGLLSSTPRGSSAPQDFSTPRSSSAPQDSSTPQDSSPDFEDSCTQPSLSSMEDDDDSLHDIDDYSAGNVTPLSDSASPGSPSLLKCDDIPQDDKFILVDQLYRIVVSPSAGLVAEEDRLATSTSQFFCLV